jgi:YndJ-like protein
MTTPSTNRIFLTQSTSWGVRPLIGSILWVAVLLITRPNPWDTAWATALLLLVPLILLPIGLDLAAAHVAAGWPNRIWRLVTLVQLPAAVFLVLAYLLPQGLLAAFLALPWLATTGAIAWCALIRARTHRLKSLDELCIDAGLVFVLVGGAWTTSDRLGFRPLDFEPVIVLLTAIHFHYAGFTLPIATGLAARQLPGMIARLAASGVIAGVPLVAMGITSTQLQLGPLVECLASWVLALGGIMAGWLHLRLALQPGRPALARILWGVSGLSLIGSMVLAASYGTRFYAPVSWLDIPLMRVLHGTTNALGFSLAGLSAWRMAVSAPRAGRCAA